MMPPENCPSEDELLAFVGGVVPAEGCISVAVVEAHLAVHPDVRNAYRVERHLASCTTCQMVVALLLSREAPFGALAPITRKMAAPRGADRSPVPGGASGLAPDDAGLRAGDHVDQFRIEGTLGAGGMSVVYDAFDTKLRRRVALKLLRWDRGFGEADTLLRKEAQLIARIHSRHVLRVYDIGEYHGSAYIVMERALGGSLRGYTKTHQNRTKEELSELLRLLLEAGSGIAGSHASGVIHGDIKPENILVQIDERGATAKVSDFGLGRLLASATRSRGGATDRTAPSRRGERAGGGTPAYMAPEQFHATVANEQSDQFAFCVTAYELLVGERPYQRLPPAVLREATALGLVTAGSLPLPRATAQALLRGLHPDPDKRHPSMAALLAALSTSSDLRRTKLAGAGILLVAATSALSFYPRYAARMACEGEATAVRALSDPSSVSEILAHAKATGSPYATDGAKALLEALSSRTAALAAAATASCGGVTEDCRVHQYYELLAIRDAAKTCSAAAYPVLVEAAARLPNVADCSLRGPSGPPTPSERALLQKLSRLSVSVELDQTVLGAAFVPDAPLAELRALEAHASTPHEAVLAASMYLQMVPPEKWGEAVAGVERAAARARDVDALAEAHVAHICLASSNLALAAPPSPSSIEMELQGARAELQFGIEYCRSLFAAARGQWPESLRHAEAALRAGPAGIERVWALDALAAAREQLEDFTSAHQHAVEARDLRARLLGSTHPKAFAARINSARLALEAAKRMRTSGETGSGAGTAKSEVLDLAAFATVRTDVAAALSDAAALASADPSDVARGYAVLAQATELAGDPALAISLWGDAIQTKGLPPNVLAEYRTSLAAIPSLEQSARLEHLQAAKRYYDEAPSVPESVRVRLMEAAISPPKEAARLAAEAHALAANSGDESLLKEVCAAQPKVCVPRN